MSESQQNRAVQNRKVVIMIFALPAIMMVCGALLFTYGRDFVDAGAINEGELLASPATLAELGLDAVPAPGRWRLLLVCEHPAGDDCASGAKLLNSIPILLGKDKPRLKLVAVTMHGAALSAAQAGWEQVETGLGSLRQQIKNQGATVTGYHSYALIADPAGNVVLLYNRKQLGSPLLTDLKRLLRLSRIG